MTITIPINAKPPTGTIAKEKAMTAFREWFSKRDISLSNNWVRAALAKYIW